MSDKLKIIIQLSSLIISILCIMLGGTLAMWAFIIARQDHDMKLIALTGVVSMASQAMATASTLLVGRTFSTEHPNGLPDPLPSNTTLKQTTTIDTQPRQEPKWNSLSSS